MFQLYQGGDQRGAASSRAGDILALTLVLGACRASSSQAPEGAPSSTAQTSVAEPAPAAPEPAPSPAPDQAAAKSWSFDEEAADGAPSDFSFGLTGRGALGRWVIKAEPGAPSGSNVLAQLDPDKTSFRFPVAVANEPVLRDVRVSVRCKMVSGRVDQACGLVARYRDQNNYLITRANALEGNIRLYTVKDGERDEVASHDVKVTANVWHEYRLDVRGDHLEVFWDGQRVVDHHDSTFTDAGRAGLWTKADSVTYFDDFKVEPLR